MAARITHLNLFRNRIQDPVCSYAIGTRCAVLRQHVACTTRNATRRAVVTFRSKATNSAATNGRGSYGWLPSYAPAQHSPTSISGAPIRYARTGHRVPTA
eukprot:2093071-Rhodomonas_salina.1